MIESDREFNTTLLAAAMISAFIRPALAARHLPKITMGAPRPCQSVLVCREA
jgi:hypothetical protein